MAETTVQDAPAQTIDTLIVKVKTYLPTVHERRLREAYAFAEKAHAGQTRMSAEPYITHPLAVAFILTDFKADEDSIVTSLLHDVVEDCHVTISELERLFGKEVAQMVDALTKLPKVHNIFGIEEHEQFDYRMESMRKIFEIMEDDVRVIVIKLCDRLHNMDSLQHFRREKQKRIAQETFDIFVKIADRLCIGVLKEKLAERCYMYLMPEQHSIMIQEIERLRKTFDHHRIEITEKLKTKEILKNAESHIHPFIAFSKLIDTSAEKPAVQSEMKCILTTERLCYESLLEIHSLWKHVNGSFRDYMTSPKSNGYRGLKTHVLQKDGTTLKITLLTKSMDEYSKWGVALECFAPSIEKRRIHLPWIEHLKKIHSETTHRRGDYMMALQNDLLKGSILVNTIDNKTLFLPPHCTALDACFFAHQKNAIWVSQIFINHTERNYSTYLKDGDYLQFTFENLSHFKAEWFEMVNTTYAKSLMHQIVSEYPPHQKIQFGKDILQYILTQRGQGYFEEIDEQFVQKAILQKKFHNLQDFFIAIAVGTITPDRASQLLFPSSEKTAGKSLFEFELYFFPEKIPEIHRVFSLFTQKEIALKEFDITINGEEQYRIFGTVLLEAEEYHSLKKQLNGLPDISLVRLENTKKIKIGWWLMGAFILLTALDPIVAYMLINRFALSPWHLLNLRFGGIFLLLWILLHMKTFSNTFQKESALPYRNASFVMIANALFSTALFTYLSFEAKISPFFYQLIIYAIFLPFLLFQQKIFSFPQKLIMNLISFTLLALFLIYNPLPEAKPLNLIFPLLAGISFLYYSFSSMKFQTVHHIHRRYLSFFKQLSLYGLILSFVPYIFLSSLSWPNTLQIGIGVSFTILFILIPYIIYFMISGQFPYSSSIWGRFLVILFLIKIGEVIFLDLSFQTIDAILLGWFLFILLIYTWKSRKLTPFTASSSAWSEAPGALK